MSRKKMHTDRALLAKVAAGDEHAFALLLDEYRGRVFSHVLTYVKVYDEAIEMVQDIFIKIWIQRERLPEVQDFPAYLFIISRNYLVSAIRKRVAERVSLMDEDILHEVVRPDNTLEAKELKKHIAAAIAQMPPKQRMVFTLSRNARLSQEEIAAEMKISKSTVKFHMAAALNFLRVFLKGADHGVVPLLLLCRFL
ncbi:MAG TPA: sigma-70 family RNA polymerase sigma factor [Agriterribacter sp.]|nr:sigma-70 family RNA polymerase sigma factor [Agriterribacter sp.]